MPDKGYLENEPKYKCISCVYLTVQIEGAITTLCIAITREEIKIFLLYLHWLGPSNEPEKRQINKRKANGSLLTCLSCLYTQEYSVMSRSKRWLELGLV